MSNVQMVALSWLMTTFTSLSYDILSPKLKKEKKEKENCQSTPLICHNDGVQQCLNYNTLHLLE